MSVSIEYWKRDSWTSYVRESLLPLYRHSYTILRLWTKLVEIADGKHLSDVIRVRPEVEYIFAGGTSPPEGFEPTSLAHIYSFLMGTGVKLREYYFLKAHGREPRTPCVVRRTPTVTYVENLVVLLERALGELSRQGIITAEEAAEARERAERASEEVLRRPEGFPEVFTDFLNAALGILVNYNEHTRFIWFLRKAPMKYVLDYYPELGRPEAFEFVRGLLGLRRYIVPAVDDPEIANLYTIYSYDYAVEVDCRLGGLEWTYNEVDGVYLGRDVGCRAVHLYITGRVPLQNPARSYPYGTVGGCLCKVNELIWGLFREVTFAGVVVEGKQPDPFDEWKYATRLQTQSVAVEEREFEYPRSYEALSVLEPYLPYVFTGEAELIKQKSGRLLLVPRWWW